MSRRALAFTSVFLICAAVVAGVPSCVTETTPSAYVCETGTASLSIVSPVDGACLAVSDGADAYIPVVVNAANFQIRPPGSCIGCGNCGHVVLRVNDVDNNASSSSVVDVDFEGKLPGHFGDLKLTVELVDDCGNPWAPPDVDGGVLVCNGGDAGAIKAAPLIASVTVTTKASCSATTSSSTGGTTGSSTAAASSSSGGTGGSSSASSSTSGGTGGAGGMDAGAGDAGDAGDGG